MNTKIPSSQEKTPSSGWDVFLNDIKMHLSLNKQEEKKLELAYCLAELYHDHQNRANGEKYLSHLEGVAKILIEEFGCIDITLVIISLLHDSIEDTNMEYEVISSFFGRDMGTDIENLSEIAWPLYIKDIAPKYFKDEVQRVIDEYRTLKQDLKEESSAKRILVLNGEEASKTSLLERLATVIKKSSQERITIFLLERGKSEIHKAQIIETLFHIFGELVENIHISSKYEIELEKEIPMKELPNEIKTACKEKKDSEYYSKFTNCSQKIMILKVADRIHNLRTMDSFSAGKIQRKIEETRKYIIPLGNMLGGIYKKTLDEALRNAEQLLIRKRVQELNEKH